MKLNFSQVSLKLSAGSMKQFPREIIPQIAFSGRSNVGKSSLLNCLIGRKKMARVGATPGKTITVNFYDIDRKLYFVDLPGYGFAKRPLNEKAKWSELTDSYFTKNPSKDALKLVLQLIDVRVGPTDDDIMMINYLIDSDIPFRVIATKADKLSPTALKATLEKIEEDFFKGTDIKVHPFSSVNGLGKDELWQMIFSVVEKRNA